jgi:alanine racemase
VTISSDRRAASRPDGGVRPDGASRPDGGPGPGVVAPTRPAWAEIDLDAIRHNASVLAEIAAPATLCAVVKAGGYGHGAVAAARAALDGGASRLAVALVAEGRELREAGIAAPILVLSQPPPEAMAEIVAAGLTPTLYTDAGVDALVAAVRAAAFRTGSPPGRGPHPVHLKVDTGMHRVGAQPGDVVALARRVAARRDLDLEGVFTHLAVADEIDDPYTDLQLDRFEQVVAELAAAGVRPPVVHAANSAGTLFHPRARFDMVRCGIALYGLSPAAGMRGHRDVARLRPALALKTRVSHVKEVEAGERLSYGLRYRLTERSVVATLPLGYADGVARGLAAAGGTVLIGGRPCRLAGTVTMDQILVDCGPGSTVAIGDEAVLIGAQGAEAVEAWDVALRTGTIAYEVVCALSARVPRLSGPG